MIVFVNRLCLVNHFHAVEWFPFDSQKGFNRGEKDSHFHEGGIGWYLSSSEKFSNTLSFTNPIQSLYIHISVSHVITAMHRLRKAIFGFRNINWKLCVACAQLARPWRMMMNHWWCRCWRCDNRGLVDQHHASGIYYVMAPGRRGWLTLSFVTWFIEDWAAWGAFSNQAEIQIFITKPQQRWLSCLGHFNHKITGRRRRYYVSYLS